MVHVARYGFSFLCQFQFHFLNGVLWYNRMMQPLVHYTVSVKDEIDTINLIGIINMRKYNSSMLKNAFNFYKTQL